MKKITTVAACLSMLFASHLQAQKMNDMKGMDKQVISRQIKVIPNYTKADAATKTQMAHLFTDYLAVKDALVASSLSKAQEAGKTLAEDAQPSKFTSLDATQKKFVADQLDLIREDAEHIGKTPELAHQRHHFTSLSTEIYPLMKAFKPESAKVYYQYCPMANSGKGAYWLSSSAAIKNPFYGSKMIGCGSTKEIL